MSRRAHYSVTALSEAAGGDTLPTLAVTLAYVAACGGDRDDWKARWQAVAAELGPAVPSPKADGSATDAPYLGLATFQPEDAERFFGRRELVATLCARLAESPLLAIFGPSGSGKSSLLRAGLLPAFWADAIPGGRDWPILLMTPGEHPLEELAVQVATVQGISAASLHADLTSDPAAIRLAVRQALHAKPWPARIVVVVDQFEEVFTLCRDKSERVAFIDALCAAADELDSPARIVLGIRADFYAHCAGHPALVAALADRQVLVGPLGEDDLTRAITEPAARVGCTVEPDLVVSIVGDARGEPGALPLVSHALLETWKRREGRALTQRGYRSAGGMQGAIAQTAERVYGELDTAQRRIAKELFLRLTALGEGTEDTRRPVKRGELLGRANRADVVAVLARLVQARLVVADEDCVTVAHEALIRGWPKLQAWLTEDRASLRDHRRLTEASAEWEHSGRDEGFLYRGARLAAWEGRELDRLNEREHAFLTASREFEERERAAGRRRVRLTVSGLGVTAVVVSVLAVLALVQAGHAANGRDLARSRQLAATARSQLPLDPELALLVARQAYDVKPTPEAEAVLRQAVVDSRVRATFRPGQGFVLGVAYSPDGRQVATTGEDGTVRIWSRAGEGLSARDAVVLRGFRYHAWTPAFSPDGTRLAAAGEDGTVRIWNLSSGRATGSDPIVLSSHRGPVWTVAFNPDGRRLASASDDGTIRLWDLDNRDTTRILRGFDGRALGVAFSLDGRRLAGSGGDGTVRIWDLSTSDDPMVLRGHENSVEEIEFSPDGRYLASAGTDGAARLWDTTGSDDPAVLRDQDGTVESVAFSPDGKLLATVGSGGAVRMWPVGVDNADPLVLRGHGGVIWSAMFSSDGRRLATAGGDGTVRFWEVADLGAQQVLTGRQDKLWITAFRAHRPTLASGGQDGTIRVWASINSAPVTLRGHDGLVHLVDLRPDGQQIASGGADGTLRLWNTDGTGRPAVLRGHQGAVRSVSYSPDGQRIASSGDDGTVRIWDLTGARPPSVLRGHQGAVGGVAYGPDGRRIASSGDDGTVRIWDLTGARPPMVLRGHRSEIRTVVFSPGGQRLASAGNDDTIRLWDLADRKPPLLLTGHQSIPAGLSFSPDGRWLASGGNDDTVRLWSTTTGAEPISLTGFGTSVEGTAFSPDGRHLAITTGDGTFRVLRCEICAPIDQVLTLAGDHVTRELTAEERRLYLNTSNP